MKGKGEMAFDEVTECLGSKGEEREKVWHYC